MWCVTVVRILSCDSCQLLLWLPLTYSVKPFCLICSFCYTSILFFFFIVFRTTTNYFSELLCSAVCEQPCARVSGTAPRSWVTKQPDCSHTAPLLRDLMLNNSFTTVLFCFFLWTTSHWYANLKKKCLTLCSSILYCLHCQNTLVDKSGGELMTNWTKPSSHCFPPLDSRANFNDNICEDLREVVWCIVCHGGHLCIMSVSRSFLRCRFSTVSEYRILTRQLGIKYKVAAYLHAAFLFLC